MSRLEAAPAAHDRRERRSRRAVELDEVDHRIIAALSEDGRASNRALAGIVGLTEATVAARIRNLQEHRVLGISAIFDWTAAGYLWDVRLAVEVEGRALADVAADISGLRYVHWVMLVLGEADIVVHALLPDRDAVVELLTDKIAAIAGVRAVTTVVNLETLKYDVNVARVPLGAPELEFPSPVVELDGLDHAIVAALAADGRQSNREIARQLGTSDGTVRLRLRRLEAAGMLRICGQVDPYRTGAVRAWAYVNVDVYGGRARAVAADLAAMSEVVILTVASGRHPLLALVVASSEGELRETVLEGIRTIDGVRGTETAEIIRTVKLDYHWARLLAGPPTEDR